MSTLPDIRHLKPLKYVTVFANSSTKLPVSRNRELPFEIVDATTGPVPDGAPEDELVLLAESDAT